MREEGRTAAFVTSAGYGEAGEEGKAAQRELVALAEELDMLLIGPNGQGVISTPASMCAQIVAPNPPPGRIGSRVRAGNLVSSYLNYGGRDGRGDQQGGLSRQFCADGSRGDARIFLGRPGYRCRADLRRGHRGWAVVFAGPRSD